MLRNPSHIKFDRTGMRAQQIAPLSPQDQGGGRCAGAMARRAAGGGCASWRPARQCAGAERLPGRAGTGVLHHGGVTFRVLLCRLTTNVPCSCSNGVHHVACGRLLCMTAGCCIELWSAAWQPRRPAGVGRGRQGVRKGLLHHHRISLRKFAVQVGNQGALPGGRAPARMPR